MHIESNKRLLCDSKYRLRRLSLKPLMIETFFQLQKKSVAINIQRLIKKGQYSY